MSIFVKMVMGMFEKTKRGPMIMPRIDVMR